MNEQNVKWHQLSADATLQKLHTNASCGLSRKEARSRYRRDGANTLFDRGQRGSPSIIRQLLLDPAWMLLLSVCLLSVCFLEIASAFSALICLLPGLVSILRLRSLEKRTSNEIGRMRIPEVCVLRDGQIFRISARRVVQGDVLMLQKGDIVPADCRLLSISTDFTLLTLMPHESGRAMWCTFPKDADRVYAYGDAGVAPSRENLLYGGSEITEGRATAVVTEIGAHTYLGAMALFEIPAECHGRSVGRFCVEKSAILKLYGFMLLVLLVPMALLGMLTQAGDRSLLSVFLSLCAIAASGSQAFLQFYFRHPIVQMQDRFLRAPLSEGRAVIKQRHTVTAFSDMTDLLILGRSAISNGRFCLHRVIGAENNLTLYDQQALCEAYDLLKRVEHDYDLHFSKLDLDLMRQELFSSVDFDTEAMDVRLLRVHPIGRADRASLSLQATLQDRSFFLHFTEDWRCLADCEFYEREGTFRFLAPDDRAKLLESLSDLERRGSCLHLVIREIGGRRALLAVVSLREQEQQGLAAMAESLVGSGVRTYFFLDDTEAEKRYAKRAGLLREAISKSEAEERSLVELMRDYRVFFGFSVTEIAGAVKRLRKDGRQIAAVGSSVVHLPILQVSSISIACDPLCEPFRGEIALQNGFSLESGAALCRHADVLVGNAERQGGGLATIQNLIAESRAIQARIPMTIGFLSLSQIFRTAMVLFSLCFGCGLMSGAQLLFGSMLAEMLILLAFQSASFSPKRLRRPMGLDDSVMRKMFLKKQLLSPICTAFLTALYAGVMIWCGVWTRATCLPFFFCSMLAIGILSCFLILNQTAARIPRRRLLPSVLAPVIVAALGIALSIAFSSIDGILLLGDWNLVSCLSLPLAPMVFLVFFWITGHKKAKR